jgi:hypothetical protein
MAALGAAIFVFRAFVGTGILNLPDTDWTLRATATLLIG